MVAGRGGGDCLERLNSTMHSFCGEAVDAWRIGWGEEKASPSYS